MSEAKKVFIADDEADILDILTLMLKAQGYEVTATIDPNIIFDLDDSKLPDIIMLDIWMSGIDGRDICNKLKEVDRTRHIPVIFISANSNIVEISNECNAQGYIAKPFEMLEMLRVIKHTLSEKQIS